MSETLKIEFHHSGIEPRDAPRPAPMRQVAPDWLARMPARIGGAELKDEDVSDLTLRSCTPMVDAMSLGYALLWPMTTRIGVLGRNPDGSFRVGFSPAQPVVLNVIPQRQAPGMPGAERPLLKLLNPWIVRTPPGTSSLIVPLLNRTDLAFAPFAAVVETDRYFTPIHFPFAFAAAHGEAVTIERGTPFAQLVPFRRDDWESFEGGGDADAARATREALQSQPRGAYARHMRERRRFT